MPTVESLRSNGTPFDGFLYAPVGEDRRGNIVTVLSALARLQLDPWDEAADLSNLSGDGARERLDGLLTRFADVPDLRLDHTQIAWRLAALLPHAAARPVDLPGVAASMSVLTRLGPLVAVIVLIVLLMQVFVPGAPGPGL